MEIVLVSKCSLDIEQYDEFKVSVLISPSKSLISLHWVTFEHKWDSLGPNHFSVLCHRNFGMKFEPYLYAPMVVLGVYLYAPKTTINQQTNKTKQKRKRNLNVPFQESK